MKNTLTGRTEFYETAVSMGFYGNSDSGLYGKKDNVRKYWEDMTFKILCRPFIEDALEKHKRLSVLDLGCGSGEGFEHLTHVPPANPRDSVEIKISASPDQNKKVKKQRKEVKMSRLLIVSNRLPVTVTERNGNYEIKESSGGLITGVGAYVQTLEQKKGSKSNYQWFGWPGKDIPEENLDIFKKKASGFNLKPVPVPERVMEKFYFGFCNKTIWPLFHYFPVYTIYDDEYWKTFVEVNTIFCKEILQNYQEGDTIWIHDYHLMLLPAMIREKLPDAKIGFFLHIPFPSFEVFRLLPAYWRRKILEGLLGADLIGFHTYDYTKYFLNCLLRILGHDSNFGLVRLHDRMIKADTFPMGIDYEGFIAAKSSEKAIKESNELKQKFGDSKLILSIDRLDYTKGVINRLEGYEIFLKSNPAYAGKVVLIMVVVPSRIGVDRYRQMKREIDEKVGSINGKFGNIHWTPIIYLFRSIDQDSLAGIYSASDIALITPLRDGMNLISKEYLACKTDLTGVLILSEMAGAARELGEAVIINPNNAGEIAEAIKTALEMKVEEQKKRNLIMRTRLKRYNVHKWAEYFSKTLDEVKCLQKQWEAKIMDNEELDTVASGYHDSVSSILFLDYDGTLVPFASSPELASPDEDLKHIITELSKDPKTDIVLISGRERNSLDEWFGSSDITIAAEHGTWIREKQSSWDKKQNLNTEWKALVYPFLEKFTDLLPGSHVEEKDFSLVWHYRKSDPEQASMRAKELHDDLVNLTANIDVNVIKGKKIIEVRNNGVSKANIIREIMALKKHDFIFAAGDDWTDEDMFSALPESAYTVKIGMTSSHAKYNLQSYIELRKLLKKFINGKSI